MFIKKSFADEIADSMTHNLIDGAINKQAEREIQLVKAADHLNAAAEIFDDSGFTVQAEVITAVLESLAAKKSKKKNKTNPKVKNKSTKGLTSERMVENLKNKGWVFDESGANDNNYASDHNHAADENCAACGDMSYADDSEQWWHISHPESGAHSNIKGSPAQATKHLALKNEYVYPGWQLHGPYKNIKDLERQHHPHLFKNENVDTLLSDDKENELYSMLEDFKRRNDSDFEDEDDEFDLEVENPFKY